MKKTLLSLSLTLTSFIGFSQTEVHHDPDNCIFSAITVVASATYEPSVTNPTTTGNSAANVSRITPTVNNTNIILPLDKSYLEGETFNMTMLVNTVDASAGRMIARLYNSSVGTAPANRQGLSPNVNYLATNEWQTAAYTSITIDEQSANVVAAGGYDTVLLVSNNNATNVTTPIFFDDIKFDTAPATTNAPILADVTADLATDNQWYYNYSPDQLLATPTLFSSSANSSLNIAATTPTLIGNDSPTVFQISREDEDGTNGVQFSGDDIDKTKGDSSITFRIYPECNASYTPTVRVRLRKDGDNSTQIQSSDFTLTYNQWNEVTWNFSGVSGGTVDGIYNQIILLLNQGENIVANDAVFYIDALQAPANIILLSSDSIDPITNAIKLQNNPVSNELEFSNEADIKNISVYNINGQLVRFFSQGEYNVSSLASGVYSIRITTATGSKSIKIIKE